MYPDQPVDPGQQPYQPQQPYPPQPPYQDPQGYPQPAYPEQSTYGQAYPAPVPPPASGPPVAPPYSGAPVSGYPTSGQPGPTPPPAGRRTTTIVLGVVAGLLAVAVAVAAILVLNSYNSAKDDLAALKADKAKRQAADDQAAAKLKSDFAAADLQGKLGKVKDLTTAANQALINWNAQSDPVKNDTINVVQDAINKCDAAVFDYDYTAAQFPASMLAGLPAKVNMSDSAYDCGRLND